MADRDRTIKRWNEMERDGKGRGAEEEGGGDNGWRLIEERGLVGPLWIEYSRHVS